VNHSEEQRLIKRVAEEHDAADGWVMPVEFELGALLCIVGSLQLSLRHPANRGLTSHTARDFVDQVIGSVRAAGWIAHAELMEAGNDPANDGVALVADTP
jgi:hypothetical protein